MIVSTVLCCHEINDQLFKSIESILSQTYKNHELILIFDNPNQNDYKILKSFKFKNKQKIKIYFFQNEKNFGLTYSLNKAIKLCSGSLIMRQDSDDISNNNRMEKLVHYLIKNPEKELVYSNVIIIDDLSKIKKYKKNYLFINSFFSSYNYRNSISHPSIMFRKKTFNKLKYYDLRFKYSQDYDLIHRFIKNSRYSIGKLDEYLYRLRYSSNSISSKFSEQQLINSVIIIFKYNYNNFYDLFLTTKSTEEMINIIDMSDKTLSQNAIFYSYLINKKIPLFLLINPIFLINLMIRYLFHPNLLIKRIFTLI